MTIEDPELDEAVKAATGGVFGAFARWVLGLDWGGRRGYGGGSAWVVMDAWLADWLTGLIG